MKTINVVAAIVVKEGKFLCTQRGESKLDYISKKFEFPGGKMEEGESEVEALVREIKEELEMEIQPEQKYITVNHTYPDFRIIMHSYVCVPLDDHICLHEHLSYQWLGVNELESLDWAAADVPIVNQLIEDYR